MANLASRLSLLQQTSSLITRVKAGKPSIPFWLCHIFGWLSYAVLDSVQMLFHVGDFFYRWPTQLLLIISGTLFCLCYRVLYLKNRWYQRHPLSHVPLAVLLAATWAYTHTVAEYCWISKLAVRDLTIGIFTQHSQYPWFPFFFSQFIGTSHVLLIWLMLYIFIQSERHASFIHEKAASSQFISAVLVLFAFIEFSRILTALAYYNPPGYLFSRYFFSDGAYALIPALLLASCVLLLKPKEKLFGSALLPVIPVLVFIVFSGGVLALVVFKLLPYTERIWQAPVDELPQSIFRTITARGPVWVNSSELVGTLRARLDTQMLIVLLFIYWRFSATFAPTHSQPDDSFNVNMWLKFWAYNLTGWWLVGTYLYFAQWPRLEPLVSDLNKMLPLAGVILGACSSVLLRAVMRRYHLVSSPIPVFALKLAVISAAMGVILVLSLWLFGYLYIFAFSDAAAVQAYEVAIATGNYFLPCFSLSTLCYFLWAMIYEQSVSQRVKAASRLKQLQLEKNLKELQLNALAGKIDPHFIFNALNNIRALVREDGEKARNAILVLSDILRNPLVRDARAKILLEEELVLIRNYIALSKIQLEHRLNYTEILGDSLAKVLIPPMILQILIENALKHGIGVLPDGGTLSLTINARHEKLHCQIINSGRLQPRSIQQGFGVGLHNVRERLALLYGSQAELLLTELNAGEQKMVCADLIFPLEYAA